MQDKSAGIVMSACARCGTHHIMLLGCVLSVSGCVPRRSSLLFMNLLITLCIAASAQL